MPSIKLALERGEPKRLELAWGAFWRNFVVRLDGAEIGRIAGQKELKAGQEFTLGDGSVLRVQLANSGITPELRVLRNGQPLPGSASDPMSLVRQAAQVLFFIGGISILIGLLAELFHWEQMRAMGAGYFTAIFGIIYLGLVGGHCGHEEHPRDKFPARRFPCPKSVMSSISPPRNGATWKRSSRKAKHRLAPFGELIPC
jgi:hypothetical protein